MAVQPTNETKKPKNPVDETKGELVIIERKTTTDDNIEQITNDLHAEQRQRDIQSMTPGLREKADEIMTLLRNEVAYTIKVRYRIGCIVKKVHDAITEDGIRKYGVGAFHEICRVIPMSEDVLRQCMRFAATFTEEQVNELCDIVLPDGVALSITHVRQLVRVEDQQQRQRLLERTVEDGWTSKRLEREVQHIVDQEEQSEPDEPNGRGRPIKKPHGIDGLVFQGWDFANKWSRKYDKVWSSKEHGFNAYANNLDKETVDTETKSRLRDATYLLHCMAKQAEKLASEAATIEKLL